MFANCATLYAIALSTDCSVAAFCKVLLTKTEGYIEEVHVDPSNGGNELLSQLLEKIIPAMKQLQPKATRLRLQVKETNSHAIHMYEKALKMKVSRMTRATPDSGHKFLQSNLADMQLNLRNRLNSKPHVTRFPVVVYNGLEENRDFQLDDASEDDEGDSASGGVAGEVGGGGAEERSRRTLE